MKIKTLSIFALALCFLILSKVEAQSKGNEVPKDLFITLERTICYGTCPDYRLEIQSNGTINFEGREYTKIKGKITDKITAEQLKQLVLEFEKADFFSLDEKYPNEKKNCPSVATDMPSAIVSIKIDGKQKTIKHYLGCLKSGEPLELFPSALVILEDKIDEIVNTKRWIEEQT